MNTTGTQLRAEREARGVSLNALAKAMGVHRSTLWRYEGQATVDDTIVTRYRECLYAKAAA